MLEIPQRLSEVVNKLLFDFEYFEYAMVNGGLFGLIAIPLIILMLISLFKDSKKQHNK
jgi:hypothetical protein